MRTEQTFNLNDDDGAVHTYTVTMRGAAAGFDLFGRLAKIIGPGLGKGFGALAADTAREPDAPTSDDLGMDFEQLGGAAGQIAHAVMAEGGHKLVLEVFAHTLRDGKPLSNVAAFGEAYQGNYGELFEAIWKVLQVDYGKALNRLPFARAFGGVPKTGA